MKGLAIILPYYKRTELTKLCFKSLERQRKKFGFNVFVCGDDTTIVPKSFKVVKCDNNPLGNKLNTLLKETKGFDAVTVIGSDDFVSDSIFEYFATLDLSKEVYYGFDNCHIYSVWDDKLGTNTSYSRSGNTIGVARLWTKPTLEKMNYTLWTAERNSGLDSDSKNRMLSKGIKEISLPYADHFLVDVKQDYNITSPEIVNTCDVFDDVNMIVARLGKIGNDILQLPKGETKQKKRIKFIPMIKSDKVKVIFIKECDSIKVGDVKNLPKKTAKDVVKMGFANYVLEETKPAPKKRTRKTTKK